MKHLPTHQPNRSRFALVFLLFMSLFLGSTQGWGQTNPTPFILANGDYSFTTQSASSTSYPTNLQGWGTSSNNITTQETAVPSADQALVASGTSSTVGIANLGSNGFQFISSSSSRRVGSLCLALNTTNRSNITIGWTASDQQSGSNYYSMGLVLQYRVGTSGTFTTVGSTTYTSSASSQATAQTFSNIVLPAGCENQSVVQLRWLYYQVGSTGTSGRDPIRLDDISVVADPSISSLGATSACVGSSLVITGTNLSGATAVTIGGAAVSSFTVNSSTQITAVIATGNTGVVSVTNPNGTATSSTSFSVIATPNATFTGVTASQNLCQGTTYTLTPNTTGGTWSTNASTFLSVSGGTVSILNGVTVSGNPANITYSVTANGCTSTSTIGVFLRPIPTAPALTSSQTFCAGSTVSNISTTGATSGATITWYVSNSLSTTYSGSTTLVNGNSYYASQTVNGCESSSRANVVVSVNPISVAGTVSANQSICLGQSPAAISLTGYTGNIQWQVSSDNISFSNISGANADVLSIALIGNLSSTKYYRAVVTSGVCNAANSAVVTITVNGLPSVTNASICAGTSGQMAVTSSCPDLAGQVSGPFEATVGANVNGPGTIAWSNAANLNAAGSASSLLTTSATSEYLQGTNYGFNIPANATINGISLTINRMSSSAGGSNSVNDVDLQLLKAGVMVGTDKAVTTDWPTSLSTATYGSSSDLWGATWTVAEINSSSFGVSLSVVNQSSSSSRTASVDYMQITVTYTLPGELNWYTQSSGGSVIATGSSFNPVGVANSGLTNTNTAGTTSYYVSCSNLAGQCRAQANFEIKPLPAVTATANTAVCAGTSITLSGSGADNYSWNNSVLNGESFTPSATTTYTVTGTNLTTGCSNTAQTTVTVTPVFVASVSIAASTTTICSGNSVTFTATPINGGTTPTYVWKKNGTTISGATASTYSTTTLANGDVITCVMTSNATPCLTGSPATSNAVTMTVNTPVVPTFNVQSQNNQGNQNNQGGNEFIETSICAGTSLNALPTSSNNGITGTWSPALNNTETTTYTFTPTVGQCASTATITITVNTPTLTYYTDADGDSFGSGTGSLFCSNPGAGYSTLNTDCNDANISISPMAEELCDGIDNDCNSATADGLGTTVFFRDADGDTFGNPNITVVSCQAPAGYVSNNTDCNDNNAAYHILNVYFQDNDGDNYGNADVTQEACIMPAGYVVNHTDCDDTNNSVNPGATEVCNTLDDDCDGLINDGFSNLVDYHIDADNDGFGSDIAIPLCQPTSGYVQNSADCDDNNANINPSALEICGNSVDEDCTAGDLAPAYYTSRQSGSWTSASTWNKSCDNSSYSAASYAPQADYAGIVTIASTHAVTVGATDAYVASAGNLNINATGSLTINGKMSVSQSLVNNGTLTVNHGASFLQSSPTAVNTGSGSYVVNMNLTGTNNGTAPTGRYWYIGSPMNNTNIYNTFYNTNTMTRIWEYLPTTNSWNAIINSSTGVGVNSTTNMAVGIGYLYRAGSAQSVTFNGTSSTFNNNITTPLAFSGIGYKYVSNPYTSYVDWKQVTRTGLNVSYWIRNAANTAYESYNATSGVSNSPSGQTTQFIPPMQGFWIYAFTTPCSLRMDNGDRTHSNNLLHAPEHNQIVRLNLNDGKTDDQAVVYENENASNGIEEYDTDKFMDENHHQVYFLEGTKEVSLDGLKDATAKQKVDMGIQITGAGTYTINATELGVEEDVVLEDKFTHTFQDMKRNNTYSFTSNAGTYNNRFVLHFTLNPQTETAMESVAVTEDAAQAEGVSVYTTTGQTVKVWVTNTIDFQNATVKVYDTVGNMIERKNMTSNELLLDLNTATGVYLVEVTGAEKTFTKKVFVTK